MFYNDCDKYSSLLTTAVKGFMAQVSAVFFGYCRYKEVVNMIGITID